MFIEKNKKRSKIRIRRDEQCIVSSTRHLEHQTELIDEYTLQFIFLFGKLMKAMGFQRHQSISLSECESEVRTRKNLKIVATRCKKVVGVLRPREGGGKDNEFLSIGNA